MTKLSVSMAKATKTILVAYLPATTWAALIFYLSNQSILPGLPFSDFDFFFKKIAHISVFGVLYLLLFFGTRYWLKPQQQTALFVLPIGIALAYACIDELHQSFVPGRYPTWRDVGYDSLGIAFAWLKAYRYI